MPNTPHVHGLSLPALLLLILAALAFSFYLSQPQHNHEDVHVHADFKVYLNGTSVNFSSENYMSSKTGPLSDYVHLHDMDGEVIHKHMAGITLGDFFSSLGIAFNSTCFVLDDGTTYCNDGKNVLKMYVNGQRNYQFDRYDFQDLDRILITYGPENDDRFGEQISSVTDKACIQSGRCPERGNPSDESSCSSSGGFMCT